MLGEMKKISDLFALWLLSGPEFLNKSELYLIWCPCSLKWPSHNDLQTVTLLLTLLSVTCPVAELALHEL